jgi:hypothetical protein
VFEIDISGSIRSHEKSPASQTVSRKPLIDLLTKAELRRFYAPHIQNTENSRSEVGSESIARSAFEDAFRAKFENSSQEFWAQIGRRKICADDLAILSRFRDQREATKRWHFDREQERQSWVIKLYELQNSQA